MNASVTVTMTLTRRWRWFIQPMLIMTALLGAEWDELTVERAIRRHVRVRIGNGRYRCLDG